jgi:hypothetical protein|tara:strand:+ start:945 stop:1130 length:186 start_codon:yes stop_codon:yes gene_type:complete
VARQPIHVVGSAALLLRQTLAAVKAAVKAAVINTTTATRIVLPQHYDFIMNHILALPPDLL